MSDESQAFSLREVAALAAAYPQYIDKNRRADDWRDSRLDCYAQYSLNLREFSSADVVLPDGTAYDKFTLNGLHILESELNDAQAAADKARKDLDHVTEQLERWVGQFGFGIDTSAMVKLRSAEKLTREQMDAAVNVAEQLRTLAQGRAVAEPATEKTVSHLPVMVISSCQWSGPRQLADMTEVLRRVVADTEQAVEWLNNYVVKAHGNFGTGFAEANGRFRVLADYLQENFGLPSDRSVREVQHASLTVEQNAAVQQVWITTDAVVTCFKDAYEKGAPVATQNLPQQIESFNAAISVLKRSLETPERASEAEHAESKPATSMKPKRSTERGEGRAKLIAALTKHHKYADGGCLNLEPIGNNELARKARVHSTSTASAFFKEYFNGWINYRAVCNRGDAKTLVAALQLMNGEFRPHHLFGAKPPNVDDRDDEE